MNIRNNLLKPSKYHSRKTIVDGVTFDSKKEANRYGMLKLLVRAGEVIRFERQVSFPYVITYAANNRSVQKKGRYDADFVIHWKDGSTTVEDVKGFRTREFNKKKEIVEQLYQIKILLI